jgi:hypothetical protein
MSDDSKHNPTRLVRPSLDKLRVLYAKAGQFTKAFKRAHFSNIPFSAFQCFIWLLWNLGKGFLRKLLLALI